MSSAPNGLQLSLPARAENVAVVRHAMAGLAEALGMSPVAVGDLKTIVTEACMNVAVHAYDGREGPLEVEASSDGEGLTVVVRDSGSGIRPVPDLDETRLRLGLPLIASLATSFSIRGGLRQGTEVEMRMDFEASRSDPGEDEPAYDPLHDPVPDMAEIQVNDERMVGPVISRVLSMLAARSGFPVDRLSEAMMIGDAIAARAAGGFEERRVRLEIQRSNGSIDIRIGPMLDGAAERLRSQLAIPGLDATLETLADEVVVEAKGPGEYFIIRMGVAG